MCTDVDVIYVLKVILTVVAERKTQEKEDPERQRSEFDCWNSCAADIHQPLMIFKWAIIENFVTRFWRKQTVEWLESGL